MSQLLYIILILFSVLAVVGLAAWAVRYFGRNRLGASGNRGRMPRLAVIDAMSVDGRRKLVLVRRDNVEHLLMIGGPGDLVIEPNIVRAAPQREQLPSRGPVGADLPPRMGPLPDANWNDGQLDEPQEPALPEPPPRSPRPSFADEIRRAAPAAERRPDPLAAIAAELPPAPSRRASRPADPLPPRLPEPVAPRHEPPLLRAEPPLPRAEAPIARAEPPLPRAEPSLPRAELPPLPRTEPAMTRSDITMPRSEPTMPRSEPLIPRGEPAMSRSEPLAPRIPAAPEPMAKPLPRSERPLPPAPPVPPPAPAPSSSALSAADQNLAEMAQRLEAALRKPAEAAAPPEPPRPAPRASDVGAPPPPRNENAAPPVAPPLPKSSAFENLEDEMASLLGRPKSPT
ncbi:flagellar biosynthetic protein FliO [Bradyrhizobium sp. U87765 SZCCT0131]|uniref:flagellar biosynthetic protein FliO n=1 Tax=unclassified Bradyrhizobium TaxID=2631580 RepID=UPI001BA75E8C|nr:MULTISPECIES: flagellar biosynthetic protein FliO [unclassified Bradyrhizobium]MBR1219766.1 flagellar biosynthetic protein FliO [Bradyrhizobium sp. U87765 SZCCT0131]MBR1262417.1 flagellar biosynthetic protein FliO [Bradyrhizobium sp. U87765 SZCCT0134]MBR1308400.1 flagellar biosynthetic protein FliO [Bradyrhizobium sp. U87765 SZCCT0110]MBR1318199.1 flagellar biosynthetic protein FliO [Bradyrhizobium sp. U87765 SZCCT0109]MBR1351902.1 flagellar biosynthetic protein FliO [Bradyrhizobium sp. U87